MGKASKFKKLRKLAASFPPIAYKTTEVGRVAYGYALIAEGIEEVQGEKVNPGGRYKRKQVVQRELNHNRKMKQAYNRGGLAAVASYGNAVLHFAQKQKENGHNMPK